MLRRVGPTQVEHITLVASVEQTSSRPTRSTRRQREWIIGGKGRVLAVANNLEANYLATSCAEEKIICRFFGQVPYSHVSELLGKPIPQEQDEGGSHSALRLAGNYSLT